MERGQEAGFLAGGEETATTGIYGKSGASKRDAMNEEKADAADYKEFEKEREENRREKNSMQGIDKEELERSVKEKKVTKTVVRKKTIRTLPDGSQKISFQFIIEVR